MMILFWIIAGILTLAAAVVLAAPLFDTRKFKSEDAFALEVYRDQLAELSRDEPGDRDRLPSRLAARRP